MTDNKFEWDDATVKEMIYSKLPIPDHYCCNLQKCLDEFKQSKKEKDIPKDFKVGTRVMDTWHSNTIYTFNGIGLWSNSGLDNFSIRSSEIGYNKRYKILEEPVKPKVPLFTTEDGVDVYYSKERIWQVYSNWCSGSIPINILVDNKTTPEEVKYFSTSEKANEYILLNKPIEVSYKELKEAFNKECLGDLCRTYVLENFFKSKINP